MNNGPHATLDLVPLIAHRLRSTSSGEFVRNESLERCCLRLTALDEPLRGQLEPVMRPIRPALERLATLPLQPSGELTKADRLDLRTVIKRVECLIDAANWFPVDGRNRLATLDLRYSDSDLATLLRSTVHTFNKLAERRELEVRVESPESLPAQFDVEKLEIVLLNLVFNAFKYTPRGKLIRVTLDSDADDGLVKIRVIDQGPGIPNSHSDEIFARSRHLDRNVYLNINNLGLCLATSRDFMRLHGGDLVLVPELNRDGCTFELVMPTRAPHGVHIERAAAPNTKLARDVVAIVESELEIESRLGDEPRRRPGHALVLVVDDSRSIQRVLAECLGDKHDIVCAFDGVEGLKKAAQYSPDLIIADVFMPKMDGEQLLRALQKTPTLSEIPVLALTGAEDPMQTVGLLELGARDALRKPFLLEEVRARVDGLIEIQRATSVLRRAVGDRELRLVELAETLAQQNYDLENALHQLEIARSEAETANLVKSNFLRIMSHELKTPIASMQLHVHTLLRRSDGGRSTVPVKALASLQRSSKRLLLLIETCMLWARSESGRLAEKPRVFDLREPLRSAVEDCRSLIAEKELKLDLQSTPEPCPVRADPYVTSTLIQGLLWFVVQRSNAGRIVICLTPVPSGVALSFSDGCPVIEAQERTSLFEPLLDLDDPRTAAGTGSGLGLQVLRDIASATGLGLTINIDDTVRNTFVLTFSASQQCDSPAEPTLECAAPS